ncbi:MAG: carbon-nitrogen hydrolase family protein [Halofilum sp. (in: g-proteobacteria)]|nr:carbon-nitrogen hydrolase family protein [Halofilum sp. (in: g-proteobacteria)]
MSRIAAVQMTSGPDVEANLADAGSLVSQAVSEGAGLVVLPENFGLIGRRERDKLAHVEADGTGPMQDFLAGTARDHGVWLVGGSVPLETGGGDRVRQSLLVYDDQGRRVARYDKIHLFDVELDNGETYRESGTIEPGDEVVSVDSPFGRLGLSVCYDLRFPELYRRLAEQGATVMLVPSAFTLATGRAHWEPLLRARAIENLAYVVAPAQVGIHNNKRETWGHAMVVDSWGGIVGECEDGPGTVVADLDPERLLNTRKKFPALEHRRL